MYPSSSHDVWEEIMPSLFKNAMKGYWREVIKTCKQHPSACIAKITSSGDTALHIAINNGEESVVKDLVPVFSRTPGALEAKNEQGDTPLHLAASPGNATMCRTLCQAHADTKLMGIRNNDNETPFFLAARHGRKEAFQALHSMCGPGEGYKYCRGKDGETILHAAISGEYFDLAFYIMGHYEELLNGVNVHGLSPLHLLASKPYVFRSGSHIRGLQKLIYHCIFVDELQLEETLRTEAADLHIKGAAKYPENYATCVMALSFLARVTRVMLGYSSKEKLDEENINDKQEVETRRRNQQNEVHPRGLVNKLTASSRNDAQRHEFLSKSYTTFYNIFIKLLSNAMVVILSIGFKAVGKIREKKAKHIWSQQIMDILLDHASLYSYENSDGRCPMISDPGDDTQIMDILLHNASLFDTPQQIAERAEKSKSERDKLQPCREQLKVRSALDMEKNETLILFAAKNGVVEMVEGILKRFPVAIQDQNSEKKNIVLLAVEHRQPDVYLLLLGWKMKETIFKKTDKDGNSALHLAARLSEYRPWLIPGAALQMQWEIMWYEFVRDSMPLHFFPRYNNESKTPREIFTETHRDLAMEGCKWLTSISESCSLVAALLATVAFATSASVPGGVKSDDSGTPTLLNETAFVIFAISSLVAICFSVTSVVTFLAILTNLTSRYQEKDFRTDLPRKLLVGLTSLFISIGSMLLSFCSSQFLVMKEKLRYAAFPLYAITCLMVMLYAVPQFPWYFDLVQATIIKVPQRSSKLLADSESAPV